MGNYPTIEEPAPFQLRVAQNKIGKYTATLPMGYRSAVKRAAILAEQEKGAPVCMRDVSNCFNRVSIMPKMKGMVIRIALGDLVKNDELYFDKESNYFSF